MYSITVQLLITPAEFNDLVAGKNDKYYIDFDQKKLLKLQTDLTQPSIAQMLNMGWELDLAEDGPTHYLELTLPGGRDC